MLKLDNITKTYDPGENAVVALKGVNLCFRQCEFVSILGQSGCGKTTMLNIIGGLDRYTEGDLEIRGKSTKTFNASDWDAYRNHSIGFVFQSYNLIPHLSVLGNVELALTLSGVSKAERRERAKNSLEKVGLVDHIHKKPNQLSGGQMQRVSIARALVNNPDIILADEPTGALDSVTSVQIMDILKEIAKERLVIMVTHNNELADKYSTRIVKLKDGEIISDSNPYETNELKVENDRYKTVYAEVATEGEVSKDERQLTKQKKQQIKEEKKRIKAERLKTSMSFFTALSLSLKNLFSKKVRTIITAIAGSIGIIGVALVLSVSNGFQNYIVRMQTDMLGSYPVQVGVYSVDMQAFAEGQMGATEKPQEFPNSDKLFPYIKDASKGVHYNVITEEYVKHVKDMDKSLTANIQYDRGVPINAIAKVGAEYKRINNYSTQAMMSAGRAQNFAQPFYESEEFMKANYDVLAGEYPTDPTDLVLIVDKSNRLQVADLLAIGIDAKKDEAINFTDILGKEYKLISHDNFYTRNDVMGVYVENADYKAMYNASGTSLKIKAVMRQSEFSQMNGVIKGLAHSPKLYDYVVDQNKNSKITKAQQQLADGGQMKSVFTGDLNFVKALIEKQMNEQMGAMGVTVEFPIQLLVNNALQVAGCSNLPASINIYPKDFNSKVAINDHLSEYNVGKDKDVQILTLDPSEMMTSVMTNMVNTISYVLVAFASISLVVSSVMIGIITYVSVVERTKEIGVLRSIGARKKDISRVFNAETLIIGFVAGIIGVLIAFVLTFPISALVRMLAGPEIGTIAVLNPIAALVLVAISMVLTLISGSIPSIIASKRDPVVALRA